MTIGLGLINLLVSTVACMLALFTMMMRFGPHQTHWPRATRWLFGICLGTLISSCALGAIVSIGGGSDKALDLPLLAIVVSLVGMMAGLIQRRKR